MADATARVRFGHADAKVEGRTLRRVAQTCSAARAARGTLTAQITAPRLLLHGRQDSLLEPEAQQLLCVQAPGRRGRVLPQARHGMLFESDELCGPAPGTLGA